MYAKVWKELKHAKLINQNQLQYTPQQISQDTHVASPPCQSGQSNVGDDAASVLSSSRSSFPAVSMQHMGAWQEFELAKCIQVRNQQDQSQHTWRLSRDRSTTRSHLSKQSHTCDDEASISSSFKSKLSTLSFNSSAGQVSKRSSGSPGKGIKITRPNSAAKVRSTSCSTAKTSGICSRKTEARNQGKQCASAVPRKVTNNPAAGWSMLDTNLSRSGNQAGCIYEDSLRIGPWWEFELAKVLKQHNQQDLLRHTSGDSAAPRPRPRSSPGPRHGSGAPKKCSNVSKSVRPPLSNEQKRTRIAKMQQLYGIPNGTTPCAGTQQEAAPSTNLNESSPIIERPPFAPACEPTTPEPADKLRIDPNCALNFSTSLNSSDALIAWSRNLRLEDLSP